MLKKIQTKRGQATMAEYVVIFFLGIGAIVAMSVFVQRTLQARIHDARNYMISETAQAHQGPIHYEYEPYYGNVVSTVVRKHNDETDLFGGGATGIFQKALNQQTAVSTVSRQAPPKDAK